MKTGGLPWMAVRWGFMTSRELLQLASDLKRPRSYALWVTLCWEAWIVEVGDPGTGAVSGFSVADLCKQVGWTGHWHTLVAAMKRAGMLVLQGKTLVHPGWLETPTGEWMRERAEHRETERIRKREYRAAADAFWSASMTQRVSHGTDMGQTRESHARPLLRKDPDLRSPLSPHPQTSGGDHSQPDADRTGPDRTRTGPATRAEWFLSNHPAPCAPEFCEGALASLSAEDWALVQFATANLRSPLHRGKRCSSMTGEVFLRKRAWYRFRPEWLAATAAPRASSSPETLERQAAELAAAVAKQRTAERTLELEEKRVALAASTDEGEKKWLSRQISALELALESERTN